MCVVAFRDIRVNGQLPFGTQRNMLGNVQQRRQTDFVIGLGVQERGLVIFLDGTPEQHLDRQHMPVPIFGRKNAVQDRRYHIRTVEFQVHIEHRWGNVEVVAVVEGLREGEGGGCRGRCMWCCVGGGRGG